MTGQQLIDNLQALTSEQLAMPVRFDYLYDDDSFDVEKFEIVDSVITLGGFIFGAE